MTPYRPTAPFRALALTVVALAGSALSACDRLPGQSDQSTVTDTSNEDVFGACFRPYGSNVLGAAMDRAGTRMLYLTSAKPKTVPDDQWQSGDRALFLQDVDSGTGRHIALTWDAVDEVAYYPTSPPGTTAVPKPYGLQEQMLSVALADAGDRFVVGVRRSGVDGLIAKLYSGMVPPLEGSEVLEPGAGLEWVPINDFSATEGIRSYALSPDGTKLAAVVGNQGEVRVFDFTEQKLYVYTKGPKNTVVVSNELPKRTSVSMDSSREPAVAVTGQLLLTWSPQSDRLAVAANADRSLAETVLALLNPVDGKLTGVRRFKDSTVPQVAWASDGKSLFVLTTDIRAGTVFGDTSFRRIAAVEGGKDIGPGTLIDQPDGYRTEPANLVNFGDDQRFLFTWQGNLWRYNTADPDPERRRPYTVSADAIVPYLMASVAKDKDLALFVGGTGSNRYATLREAVSRDECTAGAAGEALPTTAPAEATAAETTPVPATVVPPTVAPATSEATAAATAAGESGNPAATPSATATGGG